MSTEQIEHLVTQNQARPQVEIHGRHWRVMGVSPTGQPDGVNDWSGWEETEDAAWDAARKKVKELTP